LVDELVIAATASQGIASTTTNKDVIAATASQGIAITTTKEDVIASTADESNLIWFCEELVWLEEKLAYLQASQKGNLRGFNHGLKKNMELTQVNHGLK
jgi:hypothetical protein